MTETPYQRRYLAHQKRKRAQITESIGVRIPPFSDYETVRKVLKRRRSQRVFTSEPIGEKVLAKILDGAMLCPNSCNRHGIQLSVIRVRRNKELLGGLLVGGVGWVHRADTVVLFIADPVAYASPNEKEFMHYCDVGFKAMAMWLTAESVGVGACYINPNLVDKEIFNEHFVPMKDGIFCGALALGHYEKRALPPERTDVQETII